MQYTPDSIRAIAWAHVHAAWNILKKARNKVDKELKKQRGGTSI